MRSIDLWYATRATGITALVLLSATTVLGLLTAGRAGAAMPRYLRAETHRHISAIASVFLAIHVLTAVLDTYVHLDWASVFVPFAADYDRMWVALGTVGVDLFVAVAVSSILRRHISARAWRLFHWLAYLSWPVAVAHTLGMGTDTRLDWMLALVALCVAATVTAGAWRAMTAVRAHAERPMTILTPRTSLRRADRRAA